MIFFLLESIFYKLELMKLASIKLLDILFSESQRRQCHYISQLYITIITALVEKMLIIFNMDVIKIFYRKMECPRFIHNSLRMSWCFISRKG